MFDISHIPLLIITSKENWHISKWVLSKELKYKNHQHTDKISPFSTMTTEFKNMNDIYTQGHFKWNSYSGLGNRSYDIYILFLKV